MFDEGHPDEPDEHDPEARWGDPERDLPSAPSPPSAPDPPDPSGTDVPAGVARAFWSTVVLVNVALFAGSLGPMLIGFRGQWTLGLALLVLAALSGLHAARIYRRFRGRDAEGG